MVLLLSLSLILLSVKRIAQTVTIRSSGGIFLLVQSPTSLSRPWAAFLCLSNITGYCNSCVLGPINPVFNLMA
nr:hypothetical protein [Sporomusa silvacetica]